jgi:hypothetical protein
MKKLFVIFCCSLLNFQNLTAQAIERSFSAGYHSFTRILKPYGEDKWLIAGYGAPEPGVTDRDTLFIAIVGNDGQTYLRKNMTLPATNPNWFVHYWFDIMVLPDGGMLTSFQTTYCDGAFDIVSTQRLDAQGNIVWELLSGGIIGVERLPEQWGISPDGKLIGADGYNVWKLDINTGAILSKVNLEGVSAGFNVSNSFHHIPDPSVVEALPNASINEIEQTYALDTAGVNYFSQGYFYNISGGGFKVKLTNSGQSVIDQVNVNVAFRQNNFVGFCFTHSTEQKRFSNLNLPPGESMWLDFGDIQARGQVAVPAEICFWTSSPNDQPDADSEDDFACITSSYTVAVKEPDFPQASLSPNPANAFVDISFSKKMEGEKWQLFDAIGRLLQFGDSPEGQVFRLETKHLANGVYLIRFESTMLKLVVQH